MLNGLVLISCNVKSTKNQFVREHFSKAYTNKLHITAYEKRPISSWSQANNSSCQSGTFPTSHLKHQFLTKILKQSLKLRSVWVLLKTLCDLETHQIFIVHETESRADSYDTMLSSDHDLQAFTSLIVSNVSQIHQLLKHRNRAKLWR